MSKKPLLLVLLVAAVAVAYRMKVAE